MCSLHKFHCDDVPEPLLNVVAFAVVSEDLDIVTNTDVGFEHTRLPLYDALHYDEAFPYVPARSVENLFARLTAAE